MKPMLLLFAFGFGLLFVMGVVASKHFDGVVDNHTYEKSLSFDKHNEELKSVENAFKVINYKRNGTDTEFSFGIDNTLTEYSNISINSAVVSSPVGAEYQIINSDGRYYVEKTLKNGWYYIKLKISADDKTIDMIKSIYIG